MKQWMINIILFSLAIVAILIALLKVTPFEITGDTYIGIVVTLLSIASTLVIGYQIYNAIEFRKEINNQKRQYELVLQKSREIDKKYCEQEYQTQEGFDLISSLINYNSENDIKQAFYAMHHALLSSIETNRTDYEWIFSYLRKFIVEFDYQAFSYSPFEINGTYYITTSKKSKMPFKELVDIYLEPIKDDKNKIRANSNFYKIQLEYNRIMKLFYQRIENIVSNPMKEITDDERNKIINPS